MKYEIAFEFEANADFVELRFPDGAGLYMDRQSAEAGIIAWVLYYRLFLNPQLYHPFFRLYQ